MHTTNSQREKKEKCRRSPLACCSSVFQALNQEDPFPEIPSVQKAGPAWSVVDPICGQLGSRYPHSKFFPSEAAGKYFKAGDDGKNFEKLSIFRTGDLERLQKHISNKEVLDMVNLALENKCHLVWLQTRI